MSVREAIKSTDLDVDVMALVASYVQLMFEGELELVAKRKLELKQERISKYQGGLGISLYGSHGFYYELPTDMITEGNKAVLAGDLSPKYYIALEHVLAVYPTGVVKEPKHKSKWPEHDESKARHIELLHYAGSHPLFPNATTAEQLLDLLDKKFEAWDLRLKDKMVKDFFDAEYTSKIDIARATYADPVKEESPIPM
jgi:hypothetical protein